jgi:hypothetical protein
MSDRKIIEAIQQLAGTHLSDEVSIIPCAVTSVNKGERTCDCTAIGGKSDIDFPTVRLQAEISDGMLIIPAIDSVVFVAYTKRLEPFVCLFSEVDYVVFDIGGSTLEISNNGKIRLNDGSYGGLTKTKELQKQLNLTNSLLTSLLGIINGPPIPEAGNGAPSSLQTALKSALTGQKLGTFTNIENTQITHGI